VTPRPGRVDARIRDVTYNRDNVTAIDASYGTSTMIQLQSDEKIETLALGDAIAWKVEPNRKGDIIFVKPVEKNAESNLNVVTTKRVYVFLLRSNTHPAQNQTYAVRFRFPDDEADGRLLAAAKERAAHPNLKALNIANANSDYGYKGASTNKPVTVFDDGTKTWFRFEGETPAIYIVDGDRNESLVNFRTEGPYVVVDKVGAQWTLRNGQDATCIFNRRRTNLHEPTGLEPYAPQRVGATGQ
jgi:P-type conjugative transfer protein VirB9